MAKNTETGLLLIPDISGYTEFLNTVEIDHGAHVVADLIEAVIDNNRMSLTLSEVEGDACFFYLPGQSPPFDTLMEQATEWFKAFHNRLNLIKRDVYCNCGACNFIGNLTLKVVGHYGEFILHKFMSSHQLIGREVVLAHRLLKNSISFKEYFLLSRKLFEATGAPPEREKESVEFEETYPVFGSVPVVCFDLSALRRSLPPPPPREELPKLDREITEEIEINCSLSHATPFLSDPQKQMSWIEGIRSVEMDLTAPLRSGTHHVCVIGNQKLDLTLEQIVVDKEGFTRVSRIRPPKLMLKKMVQKIQARQQGDFVKVVFTTAYSGQPITGWIFNLLQRSKLRRGLRLSLRNLKTLLESESPSTE